MARGQDHKGGRSGLCNLHLGAPVDQMAETAGVQAAEGRVGPDLRQGVGLSGVVGDGQGEPAGESDEAQGADLEVRFPGKLEDTE